MFKILTNFFTTSDSLLKDLKKWVNKHPNCRFIDESYLLKKNKKLSLEGYLDAIQDLTEAGYLERKYALEDAGGVVLYDLYDSLDEIPKMVILDDGSEKLSDWFRKIVVHTPSNPL